MSTPAAIQQPAPHSALRRLVVRHPVATFLIMALTVSITIAVALPRRISTLRDPFLRMTNGRFRQAF